MLLFKKSIKKDFFYSSVQPWCELVKFAKTSVRELMRGNSKIKRILGITEDLSANRKHVWFFAYNLRMERGTVLILT